MMKHIVFALFILLTGQTVLAEKLDWIFAIYADGKGVDVKNICQSAKKLSNMKVLIYQNKQTTYCANGGEKIAGQASAGKFFSGVRSVGNSWNYFYAVSSANHLDVSKLSVELTGNKPNILLIDADETGSIDQLWN